MLTRWSRPAPRKNLRKNFAEKNLRKGVDKRCTPCYNPKRGRGTPDTTPRYHFERKPYGDRKPYFKDGAASGDKPYFKKYRHDEEGSSYERKPRAYGGRKPYGEKHSYGDRKPYGDKKPYGERKPYFKKEGSGYRKPFKKSFGGSKGPRKAYSSFKKNGDSSDE